MRDLFHYKHGKRDLQQKSFEGVVERLNFAQNAINVNSLDAPPPASYKEGELDRDWYDCIASIKEEPEAL